MGFKHNHPLSFYGLRPVLICFHLSICMLLPKVIHSGFAFSRLPRTTHTCTRLTEARMGCVTIEMRPSQLAAQARTAFGARDVTVLKLHLPCLRPRRRLPPPVASSLTVARGVFSAFRSNSHLIHTCHKDQLSWS